MSVLTELAGFTAAARWEELPPAVRERARVRLLDAIAVTLIGASSEGSRKARALAASGLGGAGEASHWFAGRRGAAEACVFTNSVSIHSITHEDGGPGGHPGASVVPAAFAAAEISGAGGAELLAGIAAGYEVQARIAVPELYKRLAERGHRATNVPAAFGAAAATASVLGLDATATASSLAFAASVCAPGIEQPILAARSDERWIQLAANARAGLGAALLAREGFHGSPQALAGESGFFETYLGRAGDEPAVTEGLGSLWRSDANTTRPYPTGGWNIGPIYATLKLIEAHGLEAAAVERVEVLHTWWGRNTAYVHPGPFETIEQALLSCPFAVACCLVHGGADWSRVQAAFADPEVAELARRVRVDGVANWGLHDGAVAIVRRTGRRFEADAADIPDALLRPSWAEAVGKLHLLACPVPRERREALVAAVDEVEEPGGVERLGELLRPPLDDQSETRPRVAEGSVHGL